MNAEFEKAGAQILVILGTTLDKARSYAEQLKAPFPVLADPDRVVYQLYNLDKNIIGLQRTASIILDQNGVVQYIKRVYNPMTWLQESQELIQAVQF